MLFEYHSLLRGTQCRKQKGRYSSSRFEVAFLVEVWHTLSLSQETHYRGLYCSCTCSHSHTMLVKLYPTDFIQPSPPHHHHLLSLLTTTSPATPCEHIYCIRDVIAYEAIPKPYFITHTHILQLPLKLTDYAPSMQICVTHMNGHRCNVLTIQQSREA